MGLVFLSLGVIPSLMRFSLFAFLLVTISLPSVAQEGDFPFGKVTYRELGMKNYEKDTSAVAVVLNEFGKARFDNGGEYNLLFEYHVRIKILKKKALDYANLQIPLLKSGAASEKLKSIEASSFTFENGSMRETKVEAKNIFTEELSKRLDLKKIAIPNVREGSVIEFKYLVESPFSYNFRPWEFQSEIPKIKSEYWALIPANYLYNITLKGFLKLTTNSSKIERQCYSVGANQSDCSVFMYGMKDIPAFIEEEYMTAKSNFISAINFELSEYRYFDGRVDKKTKEWRDAEIELKRNDDFGQQLKKVDGRVKDDVERLIANETDPLVKAKKIFYFVSQNFQWNGKFGMFTDNGVKKAFEVKIGNVADINFMLIGALDLAGIVVDPVILSTRENGIPIDLHPVISDFNYVIGRTVINGKQYLLDATDPFHPFGLLPERCLNGKGRVMADKESFWIDLNASEKARKISNFTLKIGNDGVLSGPIQTTYMGYEAVKQRKQINKHQEQKDYIAQLSGKLGGMEIGKFEIQNYEDIEKPLIVKLNVTLQAYDNEAAENFLFNPFLIDKEKVNPFKSNERFYPVDFGSPREFTAMLNLEFPEKYEIVNKPEKIALSLPNAGGRFIMESQINDNKLTLSNTFSINRTVFSQQEYLYLKELYSRIIQAQNEDLIFKKKI
jgi:hypothetical protein